MKTCLVTGAAGFIGSHLSRRLLADGHRVVAIDNFADYYARSQKEANIADFVSSENSTFIEGDLLGYNLEKLLEGVDWVFHQAAQAGVRASWGDNFRIYTDNNILATQKLLESCVTCRPEKIICASSSSVYGDAKQLPVTEEALPAPVSPYGVTKLAAEHLGRLYWKNYGLPVVNLRYFTVYGPGQRPDMAFHRFIRAILLGEPLTVFGDGEQTRDFTYITDIIDANLQAAKAGRDGEAYNIGGGHRSSLKDIIASIEAISGIKAQVTFSPREKGDVRHTHSDTAKALSHFDFKPRHGIEEGIGDEFSWLNTLLGKKNRR